MKISAEDRLNALIRSKLYQSDYSEYVKKRGRDPDYFIGEGSVSYHLSLCNEAKALCEKWGLIYPVDPCAKPLWHCLHFLHRPIEFLPDPSQWKTSQAKTFAGRDDKIFTHVNGKLALLIDLSFPREKLRSEFDCFLNRWSEKQKKGPHGHKVNKWDVYDKRIKGGNLLGITREIYGIKKHPDNDPNYNEKVNNYYQRVKRAHNSACKIIEEVEKNTT